MAIALKDADALTIDPEDFLSKLATGHAVYSFTIPPDKQQMVAEALYVIFTTDQRYRNHILMDLLVGEAQRILREHPDGANSMEYDLVALMGD